MDLQRTFGVNLRHHRRAKRWTLEELATVAGVSRETVGKIERGASAPLFETVEKLASALEVSPLVLFSASPNPPGARGRQLGRINSVLANMSDRQLDRARRMLETLSAD